MNRVSEIRNRKPDIAPWFTDQPSEIRNPKSQIVMNGPELPTASLLGAQAAWLGPLRARLL
ncbi:MAG: hypothetical protein KC425_02710, partial [Anaerolineales bacterium]|nr:hypothetical protein [Anaerolineales bacterium]